MKPFLLLLLLACLPMRAYAQDTRDDASVPDTSRVLLQRRLGHLRMDKNRLTDDEKVWILSNIDGVDCNAEWDALRHKRNIGAGMVIGGYSVATVTAAAAFVYLFAGVLGGAIAAVITCGNEEATQNATEEPVNTAGALGLVCLGSAAVGTAGLPLLIVNSRKMSKIVAGYNSASQYNTLPVSDTRTMTVSLIPATRPGIQNPSGQSGNFIGLGVGLNF